VQLSPLEFGLESKLPIFIRLPCKKSSYPFVISGFSPCLQQPFEEWLGILAQLVGRDLESCFHQGFKNHWLKDGKINHDVPTGY